jgi:hypothetical protein
VETQTISIADEDFDSELRKQGYILSLRDYSDFILRFQFQQARGPFDWGGIALRAVPHETVTSVKPDWPENIPLHLTAIVGKRDPKLSNPFAPGALWWTVGTDPFLPPDRLAELRKPGEWNEYELEMRGQYLRITINGNEVQNVMLNKVTRPTLFTPGLSRFSGRIGFLKRVGEIHYRNIEIKELKDPSAGKPKENRPSESK